MYVPLLSFLEKCCISTCEVFRPNRVIKHKRFMEKQEASRVSPSSPSSKFKTVCVFCGSNSGNRTCYTDAAIELAQELVRRKVGLVYGGGSAGLMGLISQEVHNGGGCVLGVIPKLLMRKNVCGDPVGEVRVVVDMHERKAEMARNSDCFIALPGGYGTLEELLEVLTWAQLGIHDKPVGLLNVDGYYDSLLTFIDKAVDDGFVKPSHRHILVSAPNARDLFQKLEDYELKQDGIVSKLVWQMTHCELNAAMKPEVAR